jgi:hypothetical protein
MNHVIVDAVDAIELVEILEYLIARFEVLADHDLTNVLFADCSLYGLDDLRADILQLINRLQTSPTSP